MPCLIIWGKWSSFMKLTVLSYYILSLWEISLQWQHSLGSFSCMVSFACLGGIKLIEWEEETQGNCLWQSNCVLGTVFWLLSYVRRVECSYLTEDYWKYILIMWGGIDSIELFVTDIIYDHTFKALYNLDLMLWFQESDLDL